VTDDDIDWMNASSDEYLISLCRELEALAQPAHLAAAVARRARTGAIKVFRRSSARRRAPARLASVN
jgi:hypothetical protein